MAMMTGAVCFTSSVTTMVCPDVRDNMTAAAQFIHGHNSININVEIDMI